MPRSERLQVQSGVRSPEGGISARIRRDTFVRPRGGANLEAIAQGLGEFNQAFRKVAGDHLDRRAKEQVLKGQQAFQEFAEDQRAFRELVRDGEIPAGANPHYLASFQKEAGTRAANRFAARLIAETNARLSDSTSIEEFDQVAAEVMDEFVEENIGEENRTEAFDLGFNSRALAKIDERRNIFANNATPKLQAQETEALSANTFEDVTDLWVQGFEADEIGRNLTKILDGKAAIDPSNTAGRVQAVVDGVVNAAIDAQDVSMLDVLSHVKGGKPGQGRRHAIGFGSDARKKIQAAEREIARRNSVDRSLASAQAQQERENLRNGLFAAAVDRFQEADDPQSVRLDDIEDALGDAGYADQVTKLESIRSNFVNREFEEDQAVIQDMWARMFTLGPREIDGVTPFDVDQALARGDINPETRTKMLDVLESGKDLTANPYLSAGEGMVARLFSNEFGPYAGTETETRKNRAVSWFEMQYGQFLLSDRGQIALNDPSQHGVLIEKRQELVEQAFILFGDNDRAVDLNSELPEVDAEVPIWQTDLITNIDHINTLEREWEEYNNNERSDLSPASWAIIDAAGLRQEETKIDDFIAAQKRVGRSRRANQR